MAKANAKFMKPLTPSTELAVVVGTTALPRTEVVKKMWDYIKKNGLQDKTNKRMINSDATLAPIFEGKKQISMFEMSKYLSKHLS
jgi:chromatin remodeling complex protein RSC6